MRIPGGIHAILVACWLPAAVALGVGAATAGAEQQHLAAERGRALKERTDLIQERRNLVSAIDDLAKQPRLACEVRRLGLPIDPPAALVPASSTRALRGEAAPTLAISREAAGRPHRP